MKTFLMFMALSACLMPCSRADYMIPKMSVGLNDITDILDVEVTSMNDKGHATIKVLKAYKSSKEPAKVITGTSLSCTGGSPQMFGMKSGQRYIVLLRGNDLYEERSYFEVKTEDGITQCKPGWYGDSWFNYNKEWMPLSDLESKLSAALSAKKEEP